MPIHQHSKVLLKDGWLQVAPEWLAGAFGCKYAGMVLVTEEGHLLVKVQSPAIPDGEPVMEGTILHAQVLAGLQFKRASQAGVSLGKIVIGSTA